MVLLDLKQQQKKVQDTLIPSAEIEPDKKRRVGGIWR